MAAPARDAAFRALRLVSSGDADLGDALARSRDRLGDARDRALATDLVLGTLRSRAALDYQLQRLSSKPLARLDDAVLDALRLGAHQILHLERVPVSAVVNDTVQIVKRAGFQSAAGFANAILRRLARERDALPWPERPSDSSPDHDALVAYLSIMHSHPAWLVERWASRYGATDAEAWLTFNNKVPSLTVAVNRSRLTREELASRLAAEGVVTTPISTAPYGLRVESGKVLASHAFRNGDCLVQDESSQLIAELVQASPGDRVLDACASPGGKTLALAAQVGASGVVVATDVRRRRLQLLIDTLKRCGPLPAHVVHIEESGELPFAGASFDRVLVDAPCSGLGTVRRDPDIRWRRQPEDLAPLAERQGELLDRVAPLVKPGGRLIYSTCSSEPEENEGVVAAFVSRHPEFTVVPLGHLDALAPSISQLATAEGYLQTTPLAGLEAFFGAVLARTR